MFSHRYYNVQQEVLQCTARGITMFSHRYYNVQQEVLQCTARGLQFGQRNYNLEPEESQLQPEESQFTARGITMYSHRNHSITATCNTVSHFIAIGIPNNNHRYFFTIFSHYNSKVSHGLSIKTQLSYTCTHKGYTNSHLCMWLNL